jgi:hypothetical protein
MPNDNELGGKHEPLMPADFPLHQGITDGATPQVFGQEKHQPHHHVTGFFAYQFGFMSPSPLLSLSLPRFTCTAHLLCAVSN